MNITCPNCGFSREINESALSPKAVSATCPKCQHRFKFRELLSEAPIQKPINQPESNVREPEQVPNISLQHAEPPKEEDLWDELEALHSEPEEQQEAEEPIIPELPKWERATGGYPIALVQTIMDLFSNPRRFFKSMPVGTGYIKPLLFFLIIVEVVAIAQSIWQLLGIMPPSMMTENLGHNVQAALALILYPLQITFFLFLDTGINHLCLKLLKADGKGFEGTFRAAAYSAAPMLLMIVPYIGFPMSMIGVTIYKFLGLRHIHDADAKRIVAAMALPLVLAFAFAVLMAFMAGSMVG